MTDLSDDPLHARESIVEPKKQIRLFDFEEAAAGGNRLGNLTAISYKVVNGFDSFERHYLAAAFIKCHDCRRVLDLGGLVGKLKYFLPAADFAIDVANISGKADITYDGKSLPIPDNEYDCAISLDVLEHVPPDQRQEFLKELLRVTKRFLFLSVPYKSELHLRTEQRLFDLHREAFHFDHQFLKEHLENGLIDENDCRELLDGLDSEHVSHRGEMFFTGNTCALARPIEQLWSLKAHNQVKYFLNYPKLTIHKVGLLGKLDCSGEPQAETNRLYLLVDKSRRDE